ncbi:solute carrier family 25 member 51 [Chelonus insularis]|uniref:solute carrier family 25 member 51 n=1 Tax=Chelonus insularis TaxID=460826 RepID=UPI001589BF35|nr:solute carrier family 25 member 51 [Chelonus insularis]
MDWNNINKQLFPTIKATDGCENDIELKKNSSIVSIYQITSDDYKEFLCGWGAAVINVTVTYPINKIIFRQILEGVKVNAAVKQLSEEGIRLLYRGILPPLCQKTLSLSIMFSVYEGSRSRLNLFTKNEILSQVLAANIAGTVEAVLTPLERVQTLLQDWRYHNKFKNTSHAFKHILTTHGIQECYRGLTPIIIRNGLSNVTFFMLRDESTKVIGREQTLFTNFICGAVIGGFTSTIFYPMNIIKIHMQNKIGGEFDKMSVALKDVWIARDRNIRNFYQGVHLNYIRSFVSWGVINASYYCLKSIIF